MPLICMLKDYFIYTRRLAQIYYCSTLKLVSLKMVPNKQFKPVKKMNIQTVPAPMVSLSEMHFSSSFFKALFMALTQPKEHHVLDRRRVESVRSFYEPADVAHVTNLRSSLIDKFGTTTKVSSQEVFDFLKKESTSTFLKKSFLWLTKLISAFRKKFIKFQIYLIKFFTTISIKQMLHVKKLRVE